MINVAYYFYKKYWDIIYYSFRKKYNLPKDFKFNGTGSIFHGEGEILIGEKTYIGRNCYFQAKRGSTIKIGKKVSISHNVYIYTANKVASQDFSKQKLEKTSGDVSIGDYCWIGAFAFIKEGISIGNNAVIGAHSVVTKDVESYSIVAGNPAKIIKKIII